MTSNAEKLAAEIERIKKGGAEKYHLRNREQKKLFARDRLKLLLDDGKIEFEDGMFAECQRRSRFATHGRDGHAREGHARRDGRSAYALHGLRPGRFSGGE